jgi:hypothetical protein
MVGPRVPVEIFLGTLDDISHRTITAKTAKQGVNYFTGISLNIGKNDRFGHFVGFTTQANVA